MENERYLNDLIENVQSGDYSDFDVLLEMYRPLIESAVSKYNGNIDPEDIRQSCSIAFFCAVKSYDTSSKVAFGYYARICVTNALKSELKKKSNKSDYEELDEASEPDTGVDGPENAILMREKFDLILDEIAEMLTGYEFEVFKLYLMGCSYKQISSELGKDVTSVGNAIARIKKKIKNHRFG